MRSAALKLCSVSPRNAADSCVVNSGTISGGSRFVGEGLGAEEEETAGRGFGGTVLLEGSGGIAGGISN